MAQSPVNYELKRLVGFLNLSDERLDRFDRFDPRPNFDGTDETFALLSLRYMTGLQDNSETLKALKAEICKHMKAVLDPSIPADAALKELLLRIAEVGLKVYRSLWDSAKEDQTRITQKVRFVRVRPATAKQEGKLPPIVENVPIIEGQYNNDARESFYRIIDDAIQANTLWHVRFCLTCQNFYVDSRKMTYCSKACETDFNNKRKKEKRSIEETVAKKARNDAGALASFETFLKKAGGNVKSQQEVGVIIRKLGTGDMRRGWKMVRPWLRKPPKEVWNSLGKADRSTLTGLLREQGL